MTSGLAPSPISSARRSARRQTVRRDVQLRAGGSAAGDHERAQRRKRRVDLVAGALQPLGVLRGRRAVAGECLAAVSPPPSPVPLPILTHRLFLAPRLLHRRRRQAPRPGTDRSAPRSSRSFCTRRSHPAIRGGSRRKQRHPERRVQLVHRPVRLDAGVQLGNAAHVSQVRLPGVAELGVDAGRG